MRAQMERHRTNPPARAAIDHGPDWLRARELRRGRHVADRGSGRAVAGHRDVPTDGTSINGVSSLRQALLRRPDVFVQTLTEKLIYALGRGLTADDMPVVRKIVRDAAQQQYRFTALLDGIVASALSNATQGGWVGDRTCFSRRQHCRDGLSCAGLAQPSRCRCSMRWFQPPPRWPRPRAHGRRGSDSSMPHGADMASWTPTSAGTQFELSPTLQTLAPFKDQMVVVSNLLRAGGTGGMHAAAASGWLSGAIPAHRGRGLRMRDHDRSGRRAQDRTVIAVPVTRVRNRGLHGVRRWLHARL